jgi:hypothetical protein
MSSPSDIKMSASLSAAVAKCNSTEEITELLHAEAIKQGLAKRNPEDPNFLTVVPESERVPATLTKEITVNGKTYEISASGQDGEVGLARAEGEFYKQMFTPPAAEQPARDSETGRFVSSAAPLSAVDIARNSELRSQLVQGIISPEDYILQTGTYERFAQDREDKKAFDEQQSAISSWSQATSQFKEVHSDWQGGDDNLAQRVSQKLVDLGLQDTPSVASLETAIIAIQREDAASSTEARVRDAKSPDELFAALGREKYPVRSSDTGGGFFHR